MGFTDQKKVKGNSVPAKAEILVVIPVYNHALGLRQVVEKSLAGGWQVLVIDDGSTDNSIAGITGLDCQVLQLPENQGKGAALLVGARHAAAKGFKAILTVDADGQLDPAEAELLFEKTQESWPVIVIGAREMEPGKVPAASIFGRNFSNFWVRMETGRELPDTQSGFRLYPVEEILRLPLKRQRYDFEIEVLVRSIWANIPVLSVPVSVHYPPGEERISHFHQFADNFRLTRLHTRLVLRALCPWPHKKLIAPPAREKFDPSIFHPAKLLLNLATQHGSSLQLAIAAWVGVFLGALPLLFIHTVAILYVAHKLHLNKLTAVAASQFCMPPVVPVVCIEVGFLLRTGQLFTELTWEALVLQIHERLWDWFLGSLVVGPILGALVGLLTYTSVSRVRQRLAAA